MTNTLLSYVPLVNRFVASDASQASKLDPVPVHNVEEAPEKLPRTLTHLLRANHANHSVVYHHLQYDNHMAHILSSAYLLGATVPQLHHIYDVEAESL